MLAKTFSLRLIRFARRERGTQLVELALVLPIMLMLFASIAEFGNFFYTYTTLDKATRGGARYLVSKPFNAMQQANAASLVVYGDANAGCSGTPILNGLTCSNVSVTGIGGAAGYPDRVSVQIVNYTYQPLFDLGGIMYRTMSLNVNSSTSTWMHYLRF